MNACTHHNTIVRRCVLPVLLVAGVLALGGCHRKRVQNSDAPQIAALQAQVSQAQAQVRQAQHQVLAETSSKYCWILFLALFSVGTLLLGQHLALRTKKAAARAARRCLSNAL